MNFGSMFGGFMGPRPAPTPRTGNAWSPRPMIPMMGHQISSMFGEGGRPTALGMPNAGGMGGLAGAIRGASGLAGGLVSGRPAGNGSPFGTPKRTPMRGY